MISATWWRWIVIVALLAGCDICMDLEALPSSNHSALAADRRDPLFPLPPVPKLDTEKVELGRKLFYDPILSGREMLSCSSCHDLKQGGTVPLRRTIGYDGREHEFNATSVYNVANNYRLGWRGKFTSLIDQNETILLERNLMANTWEALLTRLRANGLYASQFKKIYGGPPDRESLLDALVVFQQSLVTPNAPFDRFLLGDKTALTGAQERGFELFKSIGCVSCHQGSNIGGNMFQIFGVFADPSTKRESHQIGRFPRRPSPDADEKQVFRVPSLRNVEVTAPYFHDGRADTLEEAVAVMGESQLGRQLNESDITAIVSFLKSLTGEYNGERLKAPPLQDRR